MMGQDTLFWSAKMSLVELYIATEISWEVISELGEVGIPQFRDLNAVKSTFQRTFKKDILPLNNTEWQVCMFYLISGSFLAIISVAILPPIEALPLCRTFQSQIVRPTP
ncbi:hypothetical protein L873DRAFT_1847767 [Choiromyces venosus 120613-1]|uniref:Uncharacterized protein n=1 Tax=Choiromyces venosus 120613-1 TaxID=1336337 RepID=A0A3N4J2J4_9PEZI|nr:hypothetical protein L873DRAFT_1847767 [Choiromyces venosus 120613-1]